MYIANCDKINPNDVISVNKKIGEYLVRNGFPLMSRDKDGNFLFSKNDSIDLALKNMPFHLRLFNKKEGR